MYDTFASSNNPKITFLKQLSCYYILRMCGRVASHNSKVAFLNHLSNIGYGLMIATDSLYVTKRSIIFVPFRLLLFSIINF